MKLVLCKDLPGRRVAGAEPVKGFVFAIDLGDGEVVVFFASASISLELLRDNLLFMLPRKLRSMLGRRTGCNVKRLWEQVEEGEMTANGMFLFV